MQDDQKQRERLLDAVLPHVMFDGWSEAAIKAAARDLGEDPFVFEMYFPGGPVDLVSFFIQRADDIMEAELEKRDVMSLKIRERITLAVRLRLEMYIPYREEVKKALNLLAMPQHASLALKLTAGTVSRMWYATGDTSADFNYTKRLTLSAVYSSTFLYWLDDQSDDFHKTWEFLDRRIENVMQFETAKFKAKNFLSKKPKGPDIFSFSRFRRHLKT